MFIFFYLVLICICSFIIQAINTITITKHCIICNNRSQRNRKNDSLLLENFVQLKHLHCCCLLSLQHSQVQNFTGAVSPAGNWVTAPINIGKRITMNKGTPSCPTFFVPLGIPRTTMTVSCCGVIKDEMISFSVCRESCELKNELCLLHQRVITRGRFLSCEQQQGGVVCARVCFYNLTRVLDIRCFQLQQCS